MLSFSGTAPRWDGGWSMMTEWVGLLPPMLPPAMSSFWGAVCTTIRRMTWKVIHTSERSWPSCNDSWIPKICSQVFSLSPHQGRRVTWQRYRQGIQCTVSYARHRTQWPSRVPLESHDPSLNNQLSPPHSHHSSYFLSRPNILPRLRRRRLSWSQGMLWGKGQGHTWCVAPPWGPALHWSLSQSLTELEVPPRWTWEGHDMIVWECGLPINQGAMQSCNMVEPDT